MSSTPNPNRALDMFLVTDPQTGETSFDGESWKATIVESPAWDSVSWRDGSTIWSVVSWADVSWSDVSWSDVSWSGVSWGDLLGVHSDVD